MEPVEWPEYLPDWLLQQGYAEEEGDTVLRTEMAVGADKVRKRYTKGIDKIRANMLLSFEQKPKFKEFFRTSLGGGALKFYFKDPYTGDRKVYRFTSMPTYSDIGGGWTHVSLGLEVLP